MTEDVFKGWFHAGLAGIFSMAFGYNIMRACATHQARNVFNIGLYGAAVAWELAQVRHHWTRPDAPNSP